MGFEHGKNFDIVCQMDIHTQEQTVKWIQESVNLL